MTVPAVPPARVLMGDSLEAPRRSAEPADSSEPAAPTAAPELADPAEPAETPDPADPADPAGAAAPARRALVHPIGLVIAAVVGGALTYSFDAGSRPALIAVGAVQGVLILAWVFGTGLSGRLGAIVLGAGTAAAADIVVTHWRSEVGALVAVLGLAPIGLFGHQLVRGRRRVRVVESLSAIALLVVALTALATLIELRHQVDGPAMAMGVLLCATAALVAGHLVDWLWTPLRFDPAISRGLPAVLASVAAGGAVAMIRLHHSVEFAGERALLLGCVLALVVALFAVGAAFVAQTADLPTGRTARAARGLLPTLLVFALMSPLAYLLCLALRG